jgi:hypothetical protein
MEEVVSARDSDPGARARGDETSLREAKRQPLKRTMTSARGTACLCAAASALAQNLRLSNRPRLPSGLSWATMTASTG